MRFHIAKLLINYYWVSCYAIKCHFGFNIQKTTFQIHHIALSANVNSYADPQGGSNGDLVFPFYSQG